LVGLFCGVFVGGCSWVGVCGGGVGRVVVGGGQGGGGEEGWGGASTGSGGNEKRVTSDPGLKVCHLSKPGQN